MLQTKINTNIKVFHIFLREKLRSVKFFILGGTEFFYFIKNFTLKNKLVFCLFYIEFVVLYDSVFFKYINIFFHFFHFFKLFWQNCIIFILNKNIFFILVISLLYSCIILL